MKNGNGTCTVLTNSESVRKTKYKKEADALENLMKYQSDFYKSLGFDYVMYICKDCGTFHVGSKEHKVLCGI